MRSCLDLLWRAQLQELEKVRNIKSGLKLLSHQQFRIERPPPTALTLLFSIFILLATLFLAFVPTLRLNHWLHSFLGFLGLLKGPHGGGAPSFAAVLRLSCGQHLINQHRQDKKKRCWLMKHLYMLLKYPLFHSHTYSVTPKVVHQEISSMSETVFTWEASWSHPQIHSCGWDASKPPFAPAHSYNDP